MTEIPTREQMLAFLTARGVQASFYDAFDVEHEIPDATLAWLYGVFCHTSDAAVPIVTSPGRWHPDLHGEVELCDGRRIDVDGVLPADAMGYHRLRVPHGTPRLVLCAPDRLTEPERSFGWSIQLYAARTANSWGIGDFADLATLGGIAAASGAGFVLTCPLHAGNLGSHPMASPYSPSSRAWLHVLYISVDLIDTAVEIDDLRTKARALNSARIIDRPSVWRLKRQALQRIWEGKSKSGGPECDAWVAQHGEDLQSFATFTALTEHLGLPWQSWPQDYRHPRHPAIAHWAAEHAEDVAFHCWLQFLCDTQLRRAASQGVDIVADLAVGFDGGGYDAWFWQDILVFSAEIGAPPDRHNRDGQRWGLPAFNPAGLVSVGFAPFIAMLRCALRFARGVRIDHIMQLWRLYWVPRSGDPSLGAYVHYAHEALLAIIRIEAVRARAWVVGEDMGTVPEYVRDTMADIGMLGYRAACRVPVSMFTVNTLGTTSTHDQSTIAGILGGTDPHDMHRVGKTVDWEAEHLRQQELAQQAGLPEQGPYTDAQVRQAILARCRAVAQSASRIVVFNLDDPAEVRERPNMPGITEGWPNWCLGLPRPADAVLLGEVAQAIASDARRCRNLNW